MRINKAEFGSINIPAMIKQMFTTNRKVSEPASIAVRKALI